MGKFALEMGPGGRSPPAHPPNYSEARFAPSPAVAPGATPPRSGPPRGGPAGPPAVGAGSPPAPAGLARAAPVGPRTPPPRPPGHWRPGGDTRGVSGGPDGHRCVVVCHAMNVCLKFNIKVGNSWLVCCVGITQTTFDNKQLIVRN